MDWKVFCHLRHHLPGGSVTRRSSCFNHGGGDPAAGLGLCRSLHRLTGDLVVAFGSFSHLVPEGLLKKIAGAGFIVIVLILSGKW
jgi:hypothetical protein